MPIVAGDLVSWEPAAITAVIAAASAVTSVIAAAAIGGWWLNSKFSNVHRRMDRHEREDIRRFNLVSMAILRLQLGKIDPHQAQADLDRLIQELGEDAAADHRDR